MPEAGGSLADAQECPVPAPFPSAPQALSRVCLAPMVLGGVRRSLSGLSQESLEGPGGGATLRASAALSLGCLVKMEEGGVPDDGESLRSLSDTGNGDGRAPAGISSAG